MYLKLALKYVVVCILIVFSLSRQLDRFASIRIPGSKKERPPISHSKHNTTDWSIPSSSTSHQFEELSSKITSEKEILALFEKMMVWCFVVVQIPTKFSYNIFMMQGQPHWLRVKDIDKICIEEELNIRTWACTTFESLLHVIFTIHNTGKIINHLFI